MNSYSKSFIVAALIFCFTLAAVGQMPESDETPRVDISPTAKAQIVKRILRWYFKPGKQKKLITVIGNGIEKAWLPEIKGIEFRLLTEEDEVERTEKVYVFNEFEKLKDGRYQIGFGFGSGGDGYMGDTWSFRLSKKNVRIWKENNAGWGSGGDDYGPGYQEK